MEKGRIQVYTKKCIKLCKSNRYRVEFSNTQLEFKNTFNEITWIDHALENIGYK